MLLGLLLDDEPICLSCAQGLQPAELGRALLLEDTDVSAQQLSCVRCGDMLVDYAGLLDADDIAFLQHDI
ncbi:MAG: hypothetical protein LLG44_06120 [Chloroflexi bacterium]|nr:hypothetical protein [Chloroflexota bacterium]